MAFWNNSKSEPLECWKCPRNCQSFHFNLVHSWMCPWTCVPLIFTSASTVEHWYCMYALVDPSPGEYSIDLKRKKPLIKVRHLGAVSNTQNCWFTTEGLICSSVSRLVKFRGNRRGKVCRDVIRIVHHWHTHIRKHTHPSLSMHSRGFHGFRIQPLL